MSSTISRRGVVAALAVGAAVNVPAIALTGVAMPPASPPDVLNRRATGAQSDAELLDLGRRYEDALEVEDAADEACTAAGEVLNAAQPAMPAVLRHQIDDHYEHQFPVLGETGTICDDDRSDFYNEAEVNYLRTMPPRTDEDRRGPPRSSPPGTGTMMPARRWQRPPAMTPPRRPISRPWTHVTRSAAQSSPRAPRRSTASLCGLGSSPASSAMIRATVTS